MCSVWRVERGANIPPLLQACRTFTHTHTHSPRVRLWCACSSACKSITTHCTTSFDRDDQENTTADPGRLRRIGLVAGPGVNLSVDFRSGSRLRSAKANCMPKRGAATGAGSCASLAGKAWRSWPLLFVPSRSS